MSSLDVFIQSHAGRTGVRAVLEQSLRQSDVGDDYRVMLHPPEKKVVAFFFDVLEEMAGSSRELVMRLEDDAIVNRHIAHNLTTWPALADPKFGAGWAMSPPLNVLDYIYRARVHNPARKRLIPVCCAVMFRTRDMPLIIEGAHRWFERHGGNAMDFAMSSAVADAGRKNYLAVPCLAEHRIRVPSTLAHHHKSSESSAGLFNEHWKRRTQR